MILPTGLNNATLSGTGGGVTISVTEALELTFGENSSTVEFTLDDTSEALALTFVDDDSLEVEFADDSTLDVILEDSEDLDIGLS